VRLLKDAGPARRIQDAADLRRKSGRRSIVWNRRRRWPNFLAGIIDYTGQREEVAETFDVTQSP